MVVSGLFRRPIRVSQVEEMTRRKVGAMAKRRPGVPREPLGPYLVHPLILPFYTALALLIGIPTASVRSVESFLGQVGGVGTVVVGSLVLWFFSRRRASSVWGDWVAGLLMTLAVFGGVVVAVASQTDSVVASNRGATIAYLALVHLMLWFLLMNLAVHHLRTRDTRASLHEAAGKVDLAAGYLRDTLHAEASEMKAEATTMIATRLRSVEKALRSGSDAAADSAIRAIRDLRSGVVSPTIAGLNSLSDRVPAAPLPRKRVSVGHLPLRWNRQYFSGSVGGLIIGIVAIVASAPQAAEQLGFLVQIPLIVAAFMVSVPASLLLFLGAALTPFLSATGPSSAEESLVFLALILAIGLVSFFARWLQVVRVRTLEAISVANATISLQLALAQQEWEVYRTRVTSLLHGPIQSALVAAELLVQSGQPIADRDLTRITETVRSALKDLRRASPRHSASFSQALRDVLGIWEGAMEIDIDVTPQADEILKSDMVTAAVLLRVVSEGITNAAKHSATEEVTGTVGLDGEILRVKITHPATPGPSRSVAGVQSGTGLAGLRPFTRNLALTVGKDEVTLVADIPVRVR